MNYKGEEIKNLITKFYYRNNHLCFQILLYINGEKTVPYQEFTDYNEYKATYNKLQDQKSNNAVISLPLQMAELTN